MIGLQIAALPAGACTYITEEILQKNQLRIEAMAMVHEAIYRSDDLEHIDSKKYITHLVDTIYRLYGIYPSFTLDIHAIFLPLEKMTRVGIILNELCTNSVKHLPDAANATIDISFHREGERYVLTYLQTSSSVLSLPVLDSSHTGIGLTLVRLNAEEMDGTFDIRLEENRLVFTVVFPASA